MAHERHHTILGSPTAYGTHELKSNTDNKLEEVEKTFAFVDNFIASVPLDKDYTTYYIKLD